MQDQSHARLGPCRSIPASLLLAALLASATRAQDPSPDPALLARIGARMKQNLSTLPNYTCEENIDRSWRTGPRKRWKPLDHVGLILTVVDHAELYGRPGGGGMRYENPRTLVPGGTIGNGEFAAIAENLFLTGAAQFQYAGPLELDGRAVSRFDYRVPLAQSQYDVSGDGKTARVAYEGSFWAAQDTLDVLRIELRATGIPPALGIDQVADVVEYSVVAIAGHPVLLPRAGSMEIDYADGSASRNQTLFDDCHEFKGEAKMVPDGP